MQIPVLNKKASHSENCVQDHRSENMKGGSGVENTENTRKENLVEQEGDMEPPVEGMRRGQIWILLFG